MSRKIIPIEEFDLPKKTSCVSIIGSGGKTTLLFHLAKKYENRYKVIVTTSTKIFKPDGAKVLLGSPSDLEKDLMEWQGLESLVLGKSEIKFLESPSKLEGYSPKELEQLSKFCDLLLIEGDGSAGLPFKGWKEDEPVVAPCTTMTIGLIGAHKIGNPVSEDYVHRIDRFKELIGVKSLDLTRHLIDAEDLGKVISHPHGLLEKAKGNVVVYLAGGDKELGNQILAVCPDYKGDLIVDR